MNETVKTHVEGGSDIVFFVCRKDSFVMSAKIIMKKVIFGTNRSLCDFYLTIVKVNHLGYRQNNLIHIAITFQIF